MCQRVSIPPELDRVLHEMISLADPTAPWKRDTLLAFVQFLTARARARDKVRVLVVERTAEERTRTG
jgi:hypothetical protein